MRLKYAVRNALTHACIAITLMGAITGALVGVPAAAQGIVQPGTKPAPARPATKPAAPHAAAPVPDATSVTVAPIPSWVQAVAVDPAASLPAAPVQLLLVDRQTRIEKGDQQQFVRIVRVIKDSGGLETGSQLQLEYDPSYQKLALHRLQIQRGNATIDKLDLRKLQLLQRETGLERQMYDGRWTANMVLDDVRVGDRIEFVYTLKGANPVFGDKFVDTEWSVGSLGPIGLFRFRLIAPVERDIRHQAPAGRHEVTTQVVGPMRETLFVRRNAPQFQYDASAPESVLLDDQIQLSEYTGWPDVARWTEAVFRDDAAAAPTLRARADEIRSTSTDPQQQLRLALDLVQTEIRYLGTEIGVHSHRPAAPEAVLTQRYGDCKDKVGLLIALLKQLGIAAEPMLVSTEYRSDVAQMLPSPLAFNHVIARVRIGDQQWLLDATRGQQRGPLAERTSLGLGQGLVAGGAALTPLPDTLEDQRLLAEDVLTFPRVAADPTLEATLEFRGDAAESLRAALAGPDRAEFERQLVAEYARAYPNLQTSSPLQVEEIEGRNALRVRMRALLPRYLRFPDQKVLVGDYALLGLVQALRLPDQRPRQQALRLATPGIYRHTVTARFPEAVFSKPANARQADSNAQFDLTVQSRGTADTMRIEGEVKLRTDRVAAADWPAFRDRVTKAWPRLTGSYTLGSISPAQNEEAARRLRQLDEDLRHGKQMAMTQVQADAMGKLVWLDAQLASDRLPPAHRAQVYVTQGVQLDHLSRGDAAAVAFEAALKLDPESAPAHAAAAVNALMRNQDAGALEHAAEALRLSPGDTQPRYTKAYALYFSGRPAEAADELRALLTDTREREHGYAALWLHLSERNPGVQATGAGASEPSSPVTPAAWPAPVLQLLTGKATLSQALAAAQADKSEAPGRLCELYFYLGEQQRLNGQQDQAQASYRKAVATGVVEFNEYAFAQRRLKAGGGAR